MATIFRRGARRKPLEKALPAPPSATVLVRPEVLRSIFAASAVAGRRETGGPLIGTVQRSWEPAGERLIVSVLGTISPGPGVRERISSVALGRTSDGERAASAVRWWRSVTGMDLLHVGDWHKHPFGAPEPSPGDAVTARRMLAESAASVWLAAIAVGDDHGHEELDSEGNLAWLCRAWGSCQEVRFYREVGRPEPAPVPIRVEDEALPRLPALSWHVADPMRFAVECRLLDAAGFKTAIGSDNGSRDLTLRLRRNGRGVTVVTGPRYPEQEPKLLDKRRRRIDSRGWSPDRFLVDLVSEVC